MLNRVLALDVGGTKLAAGIVDAQGSVSLLHRVPTPTTTDADALFAHVVALLDGVRREYGGELAGIGAGCGGPMTPSGVSPLNIPAWRDFPLRRRLEETFALPCVVDNDAKAMALAEGWTGAARARAHYVGLVVSTGIGGGIVLDGRLLHGQDTNAGHVGHLIVRPGGATCACGAQGCVEAEASGTAIARMANGACESGAAGQGPLTEAWRQLRGEGDEGVASAGLSAEDVAVAAGAGDACAAACLAHAGTMVGRAIADVANLLDLRLAVVGGGVAAAGEHLFAPMRAEAERCARLAHSRDLRIVAAALGSHAGVVGAGALWFGAARTDDVSMST